MKIITVYDLPDKIYQEEYQRRFDYDADDFYDMIEEAAKMRGGMVHRWVLENKDYNRKFTPMKVAK